jgi:hypothetical protein
MRVLVASASKYGVAQGMAESAAINVRARATTDVWGSERSPLSMASTSVRNCYHLG